MRIIDGLIGGVMVTDEYADKLEKQNIALFKALNRLVNTIPVPEIELARSAWGNTNTACVLGARAKAVEVIAQTTRRDK